MKTAFELFQQAIELENALYLAWIAARKNCQPAERLGQLRARAFQRIIRRRKDASL